MSDSIIQVQHLRKKYRIGVREHQPTSLVESVTSLLSSPFRYLQQMNRPPTDEETLWALQDISFDVKRGEVLGIVGRNGAGKSTLLKVLSRITEPTEGRAIIDGRVGSLLEVGTGFHPELTGRENIYLNGAILGMKKAEIDRKFDEMVAFAEVEKFLDTPVKRYSSGMYVRLAFAVAAHLEPEVLIVDEVLAVGDSAFQRKCLGKMEDLSSHGRTILFVSHSMPTIQALCQRVLLLEKGRIIREGDPAEVIGYYLKNDSMPVEASLDLSAHPNRITPQETSVFKNIRLRDVAGDATTLFQMGDTVEFEIELDMGNQKLNDPIVAIEIEKRGVSVCHLATHYMVKEPFSVSGKCVIRCKWQMPLLSPGIYSVNRIVIKAYSNADRIDCIERILPFEIVGRDIYKTGKITPDGMLIVPEGRWEFSAQASGMLLTDRKTYDVGMTQIGLP
jgi:lipopolysaccharide transport system ATP-binding protein